MKPPAKNQFRADDVAVDSQEANPALSLEVNGYRMTGPRRAVAAAVIRHRGSFTAEALHADLKGVGRATVYRTLKLLLHSGVICKLPMPEGTPRYQLSQVEHHHHTVCTSCGRIGEFRASTAERFMRSFEREIDGEIVGHRMELHIVCATCMKNGKP